MESKIAASTSDSLIDALDFKLPDVANYITDRTSVSWTPQTGQPYTANGVRLIRFVLADNMAFLDPSTIRLYMNLSNTSTGGANAAAREMSLLADPQCLFLRGRLLLNGTVVEDIQYWGRTHTMLRLLMPQNRIQDDTLENDWKYPIPAGTKRRFVLPLPFGLFQQPYYLWLKVAPITIELELCQLATDCIKTAGAGVTQSWEIGDIQIKADTIMCTAEFTEQYSRTLLQNIPLPIPISTMAVQMQALPAATREISINVNRAFTRLKQIWFTFMGPASDQSAVAGRTRAVEADDQKVVNTFYHPMNVSTDWNAFDTMEFQLQIGAQTFPQYPVRGLSEAYMRLRKCLGFMNAGVTSLSGIDAYHHVEFIGALDLERALSGNGHGAAFSGMSTIGGEQITLNIRNIPDIAGNGAGTPKQIYLTMFYDSIVNIRAEGTEVLL